MHSSMFFPETYIVDIASENFTEEELEFLETKNNGIWIHKPSNLNCAVGIKMVSNIIKFKKELMTLKQNSDWIKEGN